MLLKTDLHINICMAKIKKLIIDSSVGVKWLNGQDEKYLDQADKILQDCEKMKVALYAPELAKYEIGNAIRYKGLDESFAKICLSTLYSLPITFVSLEEKDALETLVIAQKENITYYDAVFVNLAEKIGGILVTDNPKHQSKIKGIKVVSLKNYQ